jgi:hypothetical protein
MAVVPIVLAMSAGLGGPLAYSTILRPPPTPALSLGGPNGR